jgi:TIR domain
MPIDSTLWTRAEMMKAFLSYDHRDIELLQRLKAHCSLLRREGRITFWFDREISAGSIFSRQIAAQLEASHLFIPLVSPDFLGSHYCYNREMKRAFERCRRGMMLIVPVIVEPCDWMASPLGRFKALPRDGKPISTWANENEALLDVVIELRRLTNRRAGGSPVRPRTR